MVFRSRDITLFRFTLKVSLVKNKFLRKLNLKFFPPVSQKYAADDTLDIANADDKKTLRSAENLFCE